MRVRNLGFPTAAAIILGLLLGLLLVSCTDDEPAQQGEVDGPTTSQGVETVDGGSTGGSTSGTVEVTTDGQPAPSDDGSPDRATVSPPGDGDTTPTTAAPEGNPPDVSTQP